MTTSVPALEAKTRFGKLLDRVSREEEIVVTRHDKPVARIAPEGGPSQREVQDAVAGPRAVRRTIAARRRGKRPLTDARLKALLEKGRR